MRRVGVIGLGRIGGPVAGWLRTSPDWILAGVLVRTPRDLAGVTTDADEFFGAEFDLILDLAGPGALRDLGARALRKADVWTVSGAALADPEVMVALEAAARGAGHRLRVMGGAAAGLDGIAAMAAAGGGDLRLIAARPGMPGAGTQGTVRQVAAAHPGEASFAVASALAGPGMDAATLELRDAPGHRLSAGAGCAYGTVGVDLELATPGPDRPHPVACAVIAALQQASRTIWAG